MRKSPIIILGFSLTLASCRPPSENPIYLETGSEVTPNPYLGDWLLLEQGGDSLDYTVAVNIVQGATQMLVAEAALESLSPINVYFFLTEIDEEVIFCVQHYPSGLWLLFAGDLEENDSRLSLRRLDEDVIEGDILAENLAGFSRTVADRHSVVIRAGGVDLRTYIENTPSAFEEEPYLVFDKVGP